METMIRHITEEAELLSQASLGRRFPARLENLVQRLLSKDPNKRFRNMDEVRDELCLILNNEPQPAEPVRESIVAAAVRRAARRKSRKSVAMVAAMMFLAIAAGAYAVQQQQAQRQKERQIEEEKRQRAAAAEEPMPVTLNMLIRGQMKPIPDSSDPDFAQANIEFLRYTERHTYAEDVCLHSAQFSYLTDAGLAQIQRMPNVRSVDLTKCEYIGDEGVKHLLKFKLLALNLSKTNVTDGSLITLRAMKSLSFLAFSEDGAITNRGMKELQYYPHLTRIVLNNTSVDAKALPDIAKCKSLKTLELQHLRVRGALASLQSLPELVDLDLSGTDISDQDLEALVPIKSLHKLAIKSTEITGSGMETLQRMKQLKQILLLDALRLNKSQIDNLKLALPTCHVRCDADDSE